ncbi:MAG: tetratricopeptide repeat protein [Myxococcales bacterium]|nr:tetratricopeptide repeat protein [Myxococcales bacterium]
MLLGHRTLTFALVCALASACAYQRPYAFREAFSSAQRAQRLGRSLEAAHAFDRAAATTARPLDRDEAIYRAGQAYRRAGDVETALARFEWLATHGDDAARRTRGELEAVRIYFDRGQWDRAEQVAIEVAARQPAMGAGRRAIELALIEADTRDATYAATERFAARAWARLSNTELAATLDVELARRRRRAGRHRDAITLYERALTWRYPHNPRWDDASLELARIHEEAGRFAEALAVIDRALSMREQLVLIPGSAVRPKFPELALERAKVLEAMGELGRAADAYRALYVDFRDSTLRDDALENESRVRRAMGDAARSCAVDAQLAREFPCTRRGRAALERARACRAISASDDVRCLEQRARRSANDADSAADPSDLSDEAPASPSATSDERR